MLGFSILLVVNAGTQLRSSKHVAFVYVDGERDFGTILHTFTSLNFFSAKETVVTKDDKFSLMSK